MENRLPLLFALSALFFAGLQAEPEEPAFREQLVMSEIERDARMAQAVKVGGVVFVAGTSAPGERLEEQLKLAYRRVQGALASYGLTMNNVAQERIYVLDMTAFEAHMEIRSAFYSEERFPATTIIEVAALRQPGALVEIEAFAVAEPESD